MDYLNYYEVVTFMKFSFHDMRATVGIRRIATTSIAMANKARGMCHPLKQVISPLTNHLYKKIICSIKPSLHDLVFNSPDLTC